jgi:lipoate-protein ligase A
MISYPPATWRLLITPPADGATNMAIDEAILQALADGRSLPTLRFYQWNPPCLSLGYNQHYTEVDEDACARLGYTWVRRPTGGRAILHTDELTYSVIAPLDEPRVMGGIVDSYRRLSAGLLSGLRALGADVFQAQQEKVLNPSPSAVCFDTPSNYEITVQGKKVVGSAQVRRRGIVLQHGSVPLIGELGRIFACLRMAEPALVEAGVHPSPAPAPAARPGPQRARSQADWQDWLLARAATLEQVLGRRVSFDEAAEALTRGFAEALNLRLETGQLSDYERSLAERLRRDQYANERWNRRV